MPDFEGKWIRFVERRPLFRKRTREWSVVTKGDGRTLGSVEWYSPWRCYAFFVSVDRHHDASCLREIAGFLEARTAEQRSTWKGAKRTA